MSNGAALELKTKAAYRDDFFSERTVPGMLNMVFFRFSFILLTRTYPVGPVPPLWPLLPTALSENADYTVSCSLYS